MAALYFKEMVVTRKSDCLEIRGIDKTNALYAGVSGALLIALENEREALFVPRSCP